MVSKRNGLKLTKVIFKRFSFVILAKQIYLTGRIRVEYQNINPNKSFYMFLYSDPMVLGKMFLSDN